LKSQGGKYLPLKSFEAAKKHDDSYLVMEGDWGGQIYLVAPVRLVKCSYETLENLLLELDRIAWDVNDGRGRGLYFERMEEGMPVAGGMGGGVATQTLWVHREFEGIKRKIHDVLDNKADSIH